MGWLKIQVKDFSSATDGTRDQEKIEQRIISIEGPGGWLGEVGADQVWGQDCKVKTSARWSFQAKSYKKKLKIEQKINGSLGNSAFVLLKVLHPLR